MDKLAINPETASTQSEYMERLSSFVPPPSANYDNRPSPELRRLLSIIPRPQWQASAACIGQDEVMFEHIGELKSEANRREEIAKRICASCSVIDQCLEYALEKKESGAVWGGLNDGERRKLTKSRAAS